MNILIIGCGGIGGFFGGKLSQSNKLNVSIAVNSNLEAVQKNGLKIKSIKGDFDFKIDKIFDVNKKNHEQEFAF